jgi:Spy/CpxP family protein refolding chaperone
MGGGGFGVNLLQLAQIQDVQDDLQLTPEQKDKLRELGEASRGGGRGAMQDLSPEERRAKTQEATDKMQKQLAEILKPEQVLRLQGIRLQVAGVGGLLLPETVKALTITAEQTEKLRTIQQETMGAMRGMADLSQDERRTKMAETQKDTLAKAMEVLTPPQRETLEKLKGKILKIELPAGRGRRGG